MLFVINISSNKEDRLKKMPCPDLEVLKTPALD